MAKVNVNISPLGLWIYFESLISVLLLWYSGTYTNWGIQLLIALAVILIVLWLYIFSAKSIIYRAVISNLILTAVTSVYYVIIIFIGLSKGLVLGDYCFDVCIGEWLLFYIVIITSIFMTITQLLIFKLNYKNL